MTASGSRKNGWPRTDATDLFLVPHPAAGTSLVHFPEPDRGGHAEFPAHGALARHAGLGCPRPLFLERSRVSARRHGMGLRPRAADGRRRRRGTRPALFRLRPARLHGLLPVTAHPLVPAGPAGTANHAPP